MAKLGAVKTLKVTSPPETLPPPYARRAQRFNGERGTGRAERPSRKWRNLGSRDSIDHPSVCVCVVVVARVGSGVPSTVVKQTLQYSTSFEYHS